MVDITIPMEDFKPPSPAYFKRRLGLAFRYFSPHLEGEENVDPAKPSLLVGNHAIFGVVDSPLFITELYERTGVFPRSLGDHYHFDVPGWGHALAAHGAVPGTRENCRRLMDAGQFVLVFPGGAREVAKRRGEENSLYWKKRTGFAAMAIESGYPIIPFASVGCDDAWRIVYDGDDFKKTWLGRKLLANRKINEFMRNGDLFMPVVKGLGLTSLPTPQPFWFKVGEPIDTSRYKGRENDQEALWELRNETAAAIEGMIADLTARRDAHLETLPWWRRKLLRP